LQYETLDYRPGRVARLILNRPENLNAQSRLMLREIGQAIDEACRDSDVRVIVVSGAGRHFSAGHDLKEMAGVHEEETTAQHYERLRHVYIDDHLSWRNATKPTIAMVHGYCLWGGWMVASAMDVLFASESAVFLANPNPSDFWALPWDMPPKKAKEIVFEHRVLTAREACDFGFVNRVYPDDQLEAETLAYAERVADNDPAMVQGAKYAINQTLDHMGYSTSVTSALHGSALFSFARNPSEMYRYSNFKSALSNPHTNRIQSALARFREDQAKDQSSSAS